MSSLPSNVHISRHPCIRAKLSILRSESTSARETKQLIHEISLILATEALSGLDVEVIGTDQTPIGFQYDVESISPDSITLIPILRSGLALVEGILYTAYPGCSILTNVYEAVQTILPDPVAVNHLGLFREKISLQPVEYYNNLPQSSDPNRPSATKIAIIVDPVIATGGTAEAAIQTLREWGVERIIFICIIGAVPGVQRAAEEWPEGTQFWVGGMDEEITDKGMIKPGLGDVGDRLFLTKGK